GLITWGSGLSRRLAGSSPGRIRAWLAESLGVSLAAQAATLPAILLDFGRLSVVSPVVNLVVAPLVAPGMAAGGVALLGGLVTVAGGPAGIATLAGLPAWALLGLLIAAVRLAAGLPFASVTLDPPLNVAAAMLATGALVAVVRGTAVLGRLLAGRRNGRRAARSALRPTGRSRAAAGQTGPAARPATTGTRSRADRTRRAIVLAIGAATLAVGIAAAHRPDGTARVTILDVGQGDAVLVEGGAGSRLLVDGGPDPGRLLIALDARLPPWDRRIDAVVLTHPHEDHVAGLALLLTRYRVARVFEPGMLGPGPGYAAWEAALEHGGPTRWALGTGDRLTIDAISLVALWPDRGTVPLHPSDGGTAINDVSIVLLGEVAGRRFLLTGDVEQGVDPQLLARGLPRVQLLKVAHHGSGTATTQALLDALRPDLAVISVGVGNPYGHPAGSTVSRLRQTVTRVLRTDLDGSVTVTFDPSGTLARASGPPRLAAGPSSEVGGPNPAVGGPS
ncbi:MAG TPA: ComEC/Rec2 family competence protein, partial [Candidatus Binatus sp.]|nr:ComEC/Rec2 family competence protein [Candidatus Binatus sp.]